jgi:hypothetical protein
LKNPANNIQYVNSVDIVKITIPSPTVTFGTPWEIKAKTNEPNGYSYDIKVECHNDAYSNGPQTVSHTWKVT